MANYWVGTSGYNYQQWKGSFYPPDTSEKLMLPYYAAQFSSVEINYTFYRMPTVRVLANWARETPERFRFALKAPRRITHEQRLRSIEDTLASFCEIAQTLGSKLGPLLFQLPPFLKKDLELLEVFLHDLPTGLKSAMEFRHTSWHTDDTYQVLERFGVALCIADTEEWTTPFEATAPFGYFRLRRATYDEAALRAWRARIDAAPWSDVFAYFKHEERGSGPRHAAEFTALADAAGE